ncbi:MAG: NAD(P)/FAD-dependent oxidoreductase [Rhodospirillaceae bacterium]|nr:NAD(P)/FAD-dependent oxidoreductase [Rhodospirillaceae bacterium]
MVQASTRRTFLGTAGAAGAAALAAKPLRAATSADVLVIGAGLAGLKAALDLKDLGANVQVIEGRDRVGGRVFTLKDLPGQPEAGGNTFSSGYGRCLDMCEQVGVKVRDYAPRARLNTPGLYLQGQYIAAADWEKSPLNILPEKYKKILPIGVGDAVYKETQPLNDPDEWYEEAFFKYDIPVHALFKQQGFTDEQIDLFFNTNIWYGTSSHDVSLLMMYFQEVWFRAVSMGDRSSWAVIGGNYLLPEGMARKLGGEVHFGKQVVGIRYDGKRCETVCADGSVYTSKKVICTLPMPVMRYIRFDPALPEAHSAAIKSVPYFPMTQVHIVPKSEFWKDDGRSPAMWTDTAAGFVMINRFAEDENTVTSLTAWARGFNAVRLDQLDPADAKKLVISEIERVRPAAKGKLEAAAIKSWLRDPFAGGDYAIWGPGQVKAFVREVGKPHGPIHFAGEHTALSNRGMEGAMESAERAVLEAMADL